MPPLSGRSCVLVARNAIITGASSGIGAALARELARRGDLLEDVRKSISTPCVAVACDVTDAAAVERAVRRARLAIANAGLRGLPTAASYSASKAAMQAFLEASRIELAPHGVGVTIVNPGFIATAMTEKNRFRMPFLVQGEEAARVIADGLEGGKRVVEFPRPISLMMRMMRHVPDALYDRLTRPYGRRKLDPRKVKR